MAPIRTEEKELTLIDHLSELRSRLIWSVMAIFIGAVVAYWWYDPLITLLYRPFEVLRTDSGKSLYATSLFEGFAVKIKISALAGTILAFPVVLFNLVKFILPALHASEKRLFAGTLAASSLLSIFGIVYSYYWIVPLCVQFMTAAEFIPPQVGLLLNFEQNIFYVLQFMLIIVAVFQVPVILTALMALNILKRRWLLKAGRYVIVLIFITAGVVTPPDVVSQLAVAVPLVVLYYLSIGLARIFGWGGQEEEEEEA